MTTQRFETESTCDPASALCPHCGDKIFPPVLEELADLEANSQRELLNRVFQAHDDDWQSLASDLHDDLTQQMTGALLRLQTVERQLQRVPENVARELRKAQNLLRHSISAARRIANRVQPPALVEFGIVAGIDCLMAAISTDEELAIEFSHDAEFGRIAPTVETAAFRVVQELLANAVHHSQTRKIRLELAQTDGHVRLEVRDWGIGFDPDKVNGDGLGLRKIRERTELLGGRTEIDSVPGNGTRVVVELPVGDAPPYDT